MRKWLIKKLGGISNEDREVERKKYEEWAIKHLTGKNGEVTPDVDFYIPFYGDDICVVRSRISITNGVITSLKVAPWCQEVVTGGLITL